MVMGRIIAALEALEITQERTPGEVAVYWNHPAVCTCAGTPVQHLVVALRTHKVVVT
jgi:hypothetical protein